MNMKKIILSLVFILPFILTSCSDEPSELEKYEGTWDAFAIVKTTIDNGEEVTTETSGVLDIIAGDKVLYIDEVPYKVSGNTITLPKTSGKSTLNGMYVETTIESSGILSDNKITLLEKMDIKTTYEGTSSTTHQEMSLELTR